MPGFGKKIRNVQVSQASASLWTLSRAQFNGGSLAATGQQEQEISVFVMLATLFALLPFYADAHLGTRTRALDVDCHKAAPILSYHIHIIFMLQNAQQLNRTQILRDEVSVVRFLTLYNTFLSSLRVQFLIQSSLSPIVGVKFLIL